MSLVLLPKHPQSVTWPTHEWEQGELDPKVDADALHRVLDWAFAEPQPLELDRTHATVVIHRGQLVAERYAENASAEHTYDSWSMAKSITSALVGILVREGRLDIHTPTGIPEWQIDENDPRRSITWDHLLRMVDGLRWREEYINAEKSDVIEMIHGRGQADMAAFAASMPADELPGQRWQYGSGASNLLARKVGQIVGGGRNGMLDFMRKELFDVIGMRSANPIFDPADTFIGSSYCYATARDFARFGYLYLRNGVWDGQQILPDGWVDYTRTPTPQADQLCYGAHFWLYPGSLGTFACIGIRGQRTLIVPKLDLVIVRLGETPDNQEEHVNSFTKGVVDAFRPTLP